MDALGCLGCSRQLSPPAVSIGGCQLRAGPAEHLQPCCQHHHPAGRGGAPREQHLPVPRRLIGQRQLCPSPGVSLVSGSSAGSHWLSRRARERPLGAGSCRHGSPQRSAAPGSPGRPAGKRGGNRSCPGSTGREAAAQRERVLRTAPPEVCGRTGPGEAPCTAPSTLPSPPVPRGTPVGLGCGL